MPAKNGGSFGPLDAKARKEEKPRYDDPQDQAFADFGGGGLVLEEEAVSAPRPRVAAIEFVADPRDDDDGIEDDGVKDDEGAVKDDDDKGQDGKDDDDDETANSTIEIPGLFAGYFLRGSKWSRRTSITMIFVLAGACLVTAGEFLGSRIAEECEVRRWGQITSGVGANGIAAMCGRVIADILPTYYTDWISIIVMTLVSVGMVAIGTFSGSEESCCAQDKTSRFWKDVLGTSGFGVLGACTLILISIAIKALQKYTADTKRIKLKVKELKEALKKSQGALKESQRTVLKQKKQLAELQSRVAALERAGA